MNDLKEHYNRVFRADERPATLKDINKMKDELKLKLSVMGIIQFIMFGVLLTIVIYND